MNELVNKTKKNKIFIIISLLTIIAFILGILYISIISKENQKLVVDSITNFFTNKGLDIKSLIFKTLTTNMINCLLIWLLGISIIGIPFVLILLIYNSFVLGFTISSLIYTLKIKNIFKIFIFIIPNIINIFIIFILVYYSISFNIMLFNYLFKKKEYNRKIIVNRYLKILILAIIVFIISTFLEAYLIPHILKLA